LITFPVNKIVLEGCDLSGKTTLYNEIHKRSGFRWNMDDRSGVSMCVYANLYNRDDFYHRNNLHLEMSNLNNQFVLLYPDIHTIHERFLSRGDEAQDISSLSDLHVLFGKELERYCMLPNFHIFQTGKPEEQAQEVVRRCRRLENISIDTIGNYVREFAKFQPNRESTTVQFHFYDDGTFDTVNEAILSTPGEEEYYQKIRQNFLQKIENELKGNNHYGRKEAPESRRFVFAGEECISFIQAVFRDDLLDVHAVFRSSDTEHKTGTDVQLIHMLGRDVFRILNLDPAQHKARFRFNVNSAHVLS
jgi:deoxyadenosine/deoxycytidine kinase